MDGRALFSDLSAGLGVATTGLDLADGLSVTLAQGLQLDLHLTDAGRRLHCCATLGRADPDRRLRLLRRLLEANLTPELLADGHFAFDPIEGEVLLCRSLPVRDRNPDSARRALDDLIAVARAWRARLRAERLIS